MKRFALFALLLAAMAGCSMCQSPWDYCNAVVGPGGCPYCDFGARAGSIYAPMGPIPPTTEIGPTAAPARKPAAESTPPGELDEPPPGL